MEIPFFYPSLGLNYSHAEDIIPPLPPWTPGLVIIMILFMCRICDYIHRWIIILSVHPPYHIIHSYDIAQYLWGWPGVFLVGWQDKTLLQTSHSDSYTLYTGCPKKIVPWFWVIYSIICICRIGSPAHSNGLPLFSILATAILSTKTNNQGLEIILCPRQHLLNLSNKKMYSNGTQQCKSQSLCSLFMGQFQNITISCRNKKVSKTRNSERRVSRSRDQRHQRHQDCQSCLGWKFLRQSLLLSLVLIWMCNF